MDKINLNEKIEKIKELRSEVYEKAQKGDTTFFWEVLELTNALEMNMIFNNHGNRYDFEIVLDLSKDIERKVNEFTDYIREFLMKFCGKKCVIINFRIN